MKSELKRALLKKSNLLLMAAVIGLMMINAYYDGWKTALGADSAQDLFRMEDVIFFQKYFGNVYRVWKGSYYMVQALAPLILAAPYLSSYLTEKTNGFRLFCVSRKGNRKYVFQKALAIALSGTAVLAFSEMVFAVLTGLRTEHDTSLEFMQGIVTFREDFFLANPLLYFVLIYVSHIVYYFCFLIFATGITSFFKSRIAVMAAPFLVMSVLDIALPVALQPNAVMRPYYREFCFGGYGALIGLYLAVGFVLLMVSEKIYQKKGN